MLLTSCISANNTGENKLFPAFPTIQPSLRREETPKSIATPLIKHTIESAQSNTSTPIGTHLWLASLPQLNEPVEIVLTISSFLDAPDTEAIIILPQGVQLIKGDLHWRGDLQTDTVKTLKAQIVFTTEGNITLEGKALRSLGNGDSWGDSAFIYLYVSESFSQTGFITKSTPIPAGQNSPPPAVYPAP
jgi:hypothetical protein